MKKEEFEIGKVYFECAYLCLKCPVPEIESWVYVGINIFEEDKSEIEKCYYFQDPETYFSSYIVEGLSKEQKEEYEISEQPRRMRVSENDVEGLVYDLSELKEFVQKLDKDPYAKKIFKLA